MEGMGLELTPVVTRHLLCPLSMFGPMLALLGLIASPNSPNGGFNPPPAAHPLPPPTLPLPPTKPLICATGDIIVVVRKVAQNPAVIAS